MARVIWSPTSLGDLNAILNYISGDSPANARRLGERILNRVELLADQPEVWRLRSGRVLRRLTRGFGWSLSRHLRRRSRRYGDSNSDRHSRSAAVEIARSAIKFMKRCQKPARPEFPEWERS